MPGRVARMRRRHPRATAAVRIAIALAAVALVTWLVIVPQFGAASADLDRLATVSPGLVAGAAGAEAASLLCFSLLSRAVLGSGAIPYPRLLAIDLADLAANHTLPGGGATAAAVRYRLLRDEGLSTRRALGMALVETVASNIALVAVFVVGVLLTVDRLQSSAAVITAVAAAAVLVAGAGFGAWALVRHPAASRRVASRVGSHIPFLGGARLESLVAELAAMLSDLLRHRRRAALATAAAVGNWGLDALSLWLMVAAFGQAIDPGVLLVAYGVGGILAQLPVTPGGIGLVEGATTAALVGLGVGHPAAFFGVVGWRVFEYLMPIPVGWACYVVLRVRSAAAHTRDGAPSAPAAALKGDRA